MIGILVVEALTARYGDAAILAGLVGLAAFVVYVQRIADGVAQ